MPTAVWQDLGPTDGACSVCGAEGSLSIGEARFRRTLGERARRVYSAPPARFVTCAACGWRWTVRADDRAGDAVHHRHGAPRHAAADRPGGVDRRRPDGAPYPADDTDVAAVARRARHAAAVHDDDVGARNGGHPRA
jgi:hypothetical protein